MKKFLTLHTPLILLDLVAVSNFIMILLAKKFNVIPVFFFILLINVIYILFFINNKRKD